MTTREILEMICSHGDNLPVQTGILGLRSEIHKILENWSASRKQEICAKNEIKGNTLIDHVVLGDYDLVLWKSKTNLEFNSAGFIYVVSVNSGQEDPTDADTHKVKYPGSKVGHPPLASIIDILKSWVELYGKLAIGSSILEKIDSYKRILSRYFKLSELDPEKPGVGFFIE